LDKKEAGDKSTCTKCPNKDVEEFGGLLIYYCAEGGRKKVMHEYPKKPIWCKEHSLAPDSCPHCGSTNVKAILPFDYWMECKDCGKEFMS